MSISLDKHEVFRCPGCREFISTRVNECRFCSIPITDEIKLRESNRQANEDRAFRINNQKKWLYGGIGVFALGVLLLGASIFTVLYSQNGRIFIWSPVLILVGLGQIIYSLFDIYNEKK